MSSTRRGAWADCIVPDWNAPPTVSALVTTRQLPGHSRPPFDRLNLGINSSDALECVQRNRESLGELFALPSAPRWLGQIHSSGVAVFEDAAVSNETIEADAAITAVPGVVLSILTADCLPILLCANEGDEIAAIHAGWRGLNAGIIEQCVKRMRTPAAHLHAWLGPAIGPLSYEVGVDVHDAFVDQSKQSAQAFVPVRQGHWLCNLYTLARQRLRALGVTRTSGGDQDTFVDTRFYSYRRERITGRFASLIWIES